LNYFLGNAIFEINIDKTKCKEIKNVLDDKDLKNKNSSVMNNNILDNVMSTVKINLCDTISRFKYTKPFEDYQKTIDDIKVKDAALNTFF
jgi:hypothetical protein